MKEIIKMIFIKFKLIIIIRNTAMVFLNGLTTEYIIIFIFSKKGVQRKLVKW
jgi:hypothetical protein